MPQNARLAFLDKNGSRPPPTASSSRPTGTPLNNINPSFTGLFGLVSVSFFRAQEDREETENLTVFFCEQGKLLGWSYTPLAK